MEPQPATEIANASSQPLAAEIPVILNPEPEPPLEKVDACSQPLTGGMPNPEPEPMSEKDACSQPLVAGSKPHLLYKCLLNQYAQKLRKEAPIYRTHNEGVDHLPKFRSTVWIDGMSYTSSNTFQQRKMAEMDVSKVAYFAIMQKSKNEALHHVRQDKMFCKSILIEYAARMNITKPTYETTQVGTLVPGFQSRLVFDGVNYSGEEGKSKKEAEQLAARAAILKYLESESGNDMSEIVNCKFRHLGEMNKGEENATIPQIPVEATGNVIPVAPDYLPLIGPTVERERKRKRKNKKNAQKKMCVDVQMPITAVPPCSSQ